MRQKLSGIAAGYEGLVLADLTRKYGRILHVAVNEKQMAFLAQTMRLFAPEIKVMVFAPWDTVPYDRVSPQADIVAGRIDTLTELLTHSADKTPMLILTTAAAAMQRVPARTFFKDAFLKLKEGDTAFQAIQSFAAKNGYIRTDTVIEVGAYAVRGGIIDIWPAGFEKPVRADFFGDEIDSLKPFDPLTQRTGGHIKTLALKPVQEFSLTSETIAFFRTKYRELFENAGSDDAFYASVSAGRYIQGLEQFLPLLHPNMETIFDYVDAGVSVVLDTGLADAAVARAEQVAEFYAARQEALKSDFQTAKYYPIPPKLFFLDTGELDNVLNAREVVEFSAYADPTAKDLGARLGHDFAAARHADAVDVFDEVAGFVRGFLKSESNLHPHLNPPPSRGRKDYEYSWTNVGGRTQIPSPSRGEGQGGGVVHSPKKVIFSAASSGAAERLIGLMREREIILNPADTWAAATKKSPAIVVAEFEHGFQTDDFILITETDILGERMVRPISKRRKQNYIMDVAELQVDDYVVHQIHGVGQFKGLVTISVGGAQHDCLRIIYADDDKLFVPVENLDLLTRYGAENPVLDRLGSLSFATRKERVKKDLFAMVEQLMKVASVREVAFAQKMLAPHGLYQEFCARFPYTETEDQLQAIHEIEHDLAHGTPMDRLVCGDVGFGKTEVAMRAAFLTAINGGQVAVVVPTTLLARQHTINFTERFKNFPIRVATLSRLVKPAAAKKVLTELEQGTVDIVIGTHALLAKGIKFKNLSLLIIDEEQHFGVTHKERLKELKEGVHVLTLTATPIPRTLQLSLSGVRELSLITTPPVDRLAVKTYVMPFDSVIVKEALLREYFRGGQSFYVAPRIADMDEIRRTLNILVPELRVVMAHGQMGAARLEKIMLDFSDRKYDILLATSIVESGLDMPSVNTIVVHRADMFGLSALYQLRGRVGRGKLRAYAYLTTPPNMRLSDTAQKRLTVMQGLDSLGVGFQLASHDLDIRGAGNLLGKEQSGHIREVGVALYQKMLADAVANLKEKKDPGSVFDSIDLAPQISIGIPVLIPESYVADLDLRLQLYRRIANLETPEELEQMRVEFMDRFGKYPTEVDNLFNVIGLKILAKRANIERIEVGPKGASISFYKNTSKNPAGLIEYVMGQLGIMKIRPDQKLLVLRPMEAPEERLGIIRKIVEKIASIAECDKQ